METQTDKKHKIESNKIILIVFYEDKFNFERV